MNWALPLVGLLKVHYGKQEAIKHAVFRVVLPAVLAVNQQFGVVGVERGWAALAYGIIGWNIYRQAAESRPRDIHESNSPDQAVGE